jgi:CRP/FNR family transcriptional regulator, anaerobic regulatory protein
MQIASFDFFGILDDKEREFVKTKLKKVKLPASSILFFNGDLCDGILLLEKGKVRLYLQGDGEETITLYHLMPNEQCIVNTSSALSGTPAIATAETVTEIEGWLFPKDALRELMMRSAKYQEYIFSLFTVRLASLAEIIEDIKFSRLRTRLIRWLLAQKTAEILTTHEHIAEELGSARVVVSRVLKTIENEGLIELGRGKIIIKKECLCAS